MEDDRPNPDEILKAIQHEEAKVSLGKLKIFFGMAAGVGKTYAMLEEAHQKVREGVSVLVGIVNTHGRKETEALIQGLDILPEKRIQYKDTIFHELDLEAILEIKPQLVIVDELAHTNVPGSKHPKRWQDVMELLDAGIDVFTSLNVQHVESRKDVVEHLTEVQIRETVPDLVLERAATIEIIDIPPSELIQRLKEGKVYLGEQSRLAAQNFFKEENLTALRQIALRFTAEKVEHDLRGLSQDERWRTREKLMVAISPSPSSQHLIRAARRLSFELDAPWIAVYVDTGRKLTDQDQQRLSSYFNLATELGAEIVTTHDLDVAHAIQRVARQKKVTRIVVGRSPFRRRSIWNFFKPSLIERLENESKNIDLLILRQDKLSSIYQRLFPTIRFISSKASYLTTTLFVTFLTCLGFLTDPFIGYKSVGFIFLLGIFGFSFFAGRGPLFFAAFLSALSWASFFIPSNPLTLFSASEDIALFFIFFSAALIMGILTGRLREQEHFLRLREEKAEHLYSIEHEIANSSNFQDFRIKANSRLETIFPGKFDILIKSDNHQIVFDTPLFHQKEKEKEKAVAQWVVQNGKIGGWSTDTLPSARAIYFPIKFSNFPVGVLLYLPETERPLSMDEMSFIQTVTQQLGIYLEKYIVEERIGRQDYSRQIERMHQSLLQSLNKSLYTPLEGMSELFKQFHALPSKGETAPIVRKMENYLWSIRLSIDNLIGISELKSGYMHFEQKNYPIQQLVSQCLADLKPFQSTHSVMVQLPPKTVSLPFDFNLMKLALTNMILNAFQYSPKDRPIQIKVELYNTSYKISVADEGPGLPKDILPMLTEKFSHLTGPQQQGVGLAIVKAVADIHQGKVEVLQSEKGGTEISIHVALSAHETPSIKPMQNQPTI